MNNLDLVEKVSSSPIMSDFNGVVVRSNLFKTAYAGYIFAYRNPITLPRIFWLGALRGYELMLNSNVNEEDILRKKVSLIKGVQVGQFEKLAIDPNPFEINFDFINFVEKMKKELCKDEITIPVITRDSGSYLKYWLENASNMLLHYNNPLDFLELYGIKLEIIANSFEIENGYYTGEIISSEESKTLFPDDSLITADKRKKYMLGDKPRVVIVDTEEYIHLSHLGYDSKKLCLINIQDKKSLNERVKEAVDFFNS